MLPIQVTESWKGLKMLEMLGRMRADNNHAAEGSSSLHRDVFFFRLSLAASLHCSPQTHDRRGIQKKSQHHLPDGIGGDAL